METILTLKNIEAGYKDLKVLNGVSLTVRKGEIIALLGQNGAGKSTILKVIIGLLRHSRGHLQLHGTTAYVPQGKRIFPSLTAKENVLLTSKETEIPSFLLELFPILSHKSDRRASELSGGEQQMVALARGLISKPELLLLDEPSLGLSPKYVKEIFAVIDRIRHEFGISIIVIENNLTSLLKIANRGYVLEKGEVVRELTKDNLENQDEVYKSLIGDIT